MSSSSNFDSFQSPNCTATYKYTSSGTKTTWKTFHFDLSDRSDFRITDSLSMAVHTFAQHIVTSLSVDETLLLRYVKLSTNFRKPSFRLTMAPSLLKHMYSVLSAFMWRSIPPAACSRLYSRDSALVGVFARSALSSL